MFHVVSKDAVRVKLILKLFAKFRVLAKIHTKTGFLRIGYVPVFVIFECAFSELLFEYFSSVRPRVTISNNLMLPRDREGTTYFK